MTTDKIAIIALIMMSVLSTHNVMYNWGRGSKSFNASDMSTQKPCSLDTFAAYTHEFIFKWFVSPLEQTEVGKYVMFEES